MADDIALAIGLDSAPATAGAASFVKSSELIKAAAGEMIASLAAVQAQMAKAFAATPNSPASAPTAAASAAVATAKTNTEAYAQSISGVTLANKSAADSSSVFERALGVQAERAKALRAAMGDVEKGAGTTAVAVTSLGVAHSQATRAAVEHTSAVAAAGRAYETSGIHAGSLVREVRAVFDELSSGRSRQAIGSLTLLFTRGLGVGLAPFAAGAAALAVPVTAVASWEAYQRSITAVGNEMRKTGDGDGVTRSQLEQNAQAVSASSNLSVKQVREVQGALLDSGKITSDALLRATQVTADYAKATGEDAAKAADELSKALQDPAKGAEELDKQFDFLSTTQKRAIEDAELSGDASKAQGLLLDALGLKMRDLATGAVAPLEGYFTRASRAVSNFFDDIGKAESVQTLADRITAVRTAVNQLAPTSNGGPPPISPAAAGVAPNSAAARMAADHAQFNLSTRPDPNAYTRQDMQSQLGTLEMAQGQDEDEANERESLKYFSDRGKAFDDLAQKADPLTRALRLLGDAMADLDRHAAEGTGDPTQVAQLQLQNYYQKYNEQTPAQRQQRQMGEAIAVTRSSHAQRARVAAGLDAGQQFDALAVRPVGTSRENYIANAQTIAAQPQITAASDSDSRYQLQIAGQKKVFDAAQQGYAQEKAAQALLQAQIEHDDNANIDVESRKSQLIKLEYEQQTVSLQDRIRATAQSTTAATAEAAATALGSAALAQAKANAEAEAATRTALATAQSDADRKVVQSQQQQLANALLLNDAARQNVTAAGDIQEKQDELTIAKAEQALMLQAPELREQELAKLREKLSIEHDLALADPDQKQQLLDLADQTAKVTAQTKQMEKEHQAATKAIDQVGQIGERALERLTSGTGSFKDKWHSAWEGAAEDVAKLIEKMALIQPLEQAIAQATGQSADGSSGGSGSLGGTLLKGLFAAGSGANLGAASEIPGFASGGDPAVNQLSLVGEQGPELFVPKTSGTVIPASQTAAMMNGGGGGSGGHTFMIDARGSDAGVEARINKAINAAIPHIVQASGQHAQSLVFSNIGRGGNAAKLVGRR